MTALAVWSLITAGFSIGGLLISGRSPKFGWRYGIGCQIVWIVAGWVTGQPGTIILSIVFVILYVHNLRTNRRTTWVRPRAGQTVAEALRAAYHAELARTGT